MAYTGRFGQSDDFRRDELIRIIEQKKQSDNKKLIIFTAYADTAQYLFDELAARGYRRLASASGQNNFSTGNHNKKNFT